MKDDQKTSVKLSFMQKKSGQALHSNQNKPGTCGELHKQAVAMFNNEGGPAKF